MTTTAYIARAAAEALASVNGVEGAAAAITDGTAMHTPDQLAGWYAFEADRDGNGAGLAGVTAAGMAAHASFIAEAGAEFDEDEAAAWARKFWAAAVAAELDEAIAAYDGDTGPGAWETSTEAGSASDTASGAALVYAWPEVAHGEGVAGDEPWTTWGGNAIAAAAGFIVGEGHDDNDDAGTIYCHATVEGSRLVVTALANGRVIQTGQRIPDLELGTAAECGKAEDYASDEDLWVEYIDPDAAAPFASISRDERIGLALSVIVNNR